MIYFDNAATGGRKPDCVLTAVASSVKVCANPGRSGHKLSLSCAKIVQACRNALNNYFDGYGYERVALTKNCTEALNIALFGCLQKGDHVIVSCMEHNSVLRPLEKMKQEGIIRYDVCPLKSEAGNGIFALDIAELQKSLRPETKLVTITAASNVTGMVNNVAKIRQILPEHVLLLVDGAQGGGHFDIKMRGAGIDLLALAGHKGMLGIQGSGALLFSERVSPRPLLYGGTGSVSLTLDMPDFYPDALEAGTLSYPAIVSLLEGVRHLTIHQADMEKRILALTAYLIQKLNGLPNYTVYSKPNPCGIVAFARRNIPSEYLAEILSTKYSIAVRGGLHCAPLMHKALGTLEDGLVRVSFSHYNNENEIDKLIAALKNI